MEYPHRVRENVTFDIALLLTYPTVPVSPRPCQNGHKGAENSPYSLDSVKRLGGKGFFLCHQSKIFSSLYD